MGWGLILQGVPVLGTVDEIEDREVRIVYDPQTSDSSTYLHVGTGSGNKELTSFFWGPTHMRSKDLTPKNM